MTLGVRRSFGVAAGPSRGGAVIGPCSTRDGLTTVDAASPYCVVRVTAATRADRKTAARRSTDVPRASRRRGIRRGVHTPRPVDFRRESSRTFPAAQWTYYD